MSKVVMLGNTALAVELSVASSENARLRTKLAASIACCDSYADENQKFHDRFTKAEAQVAKLREALEQCVKQLEAYDKDVPESARAVLAETKGLKETGDTNEG